MNLHLQYLNGNIKAWNPESFDSLPVSKLTDLTYYKPDVYGEKYRYSISDYNYSPAHRKAFDKYFNRIDVTNMIVKSKKTEVKITINRPVTVPDLKEILQFAENQETTDKYINTEMHITGNYAEIDVIFDEDGNMTVN